MIVCLLRTDKLCVMPFLLTFSCHYKLNNFFILFLLSLLFVFDGFKNDLFLENLFLTLMSITSYLFFLVLFLSFLKDMIVHLLRTDKLYVMHFHFSFFHFYYILNNFTFVSLITWFLSFLFLLFLFEVFRFFTNDLCFQNKSPRLIFLASCLFFLVLFLSFLKDMIVCLLGNDQLLVVPFILPFSSHWIFDKFASTFAITWIHSFLFPFFLFLFDAFGFFKIVLWFKNQSSRLMLFILTFFSGFYIINNFSLVSFLLSLFVLRDFNFFRKDLFLENLFPNLIFISKWFFFLFLLLPFM